MRGEFEWVQHYRRELVSLWEAAGIDILKEGVFHNSFERSWNAHGHRFDEVDEEEDNMTPPELLQVGP